MILVPEHAQRARLGLLVFVLGFGFVLVAPVGLFVVPLAALLLTSPDRSPGLVLASSFCGGIGLWWLWTIGDPGDQFVRAACVVGTASFLLLTRTTRLSVIHRALLAIGAAAVGSIGAVALLGHSWPEIVWWTERRAAIAQAYVMQFWLASQGGSAQFFGGDEAAMQMEGMIRSMPTLLTNLFPALLAIQMLAGFGLSTFLIARMRVRVPGVPIGEFTRFRFTEHLGWLVVGALIVALLANSTTLRVPAVNILLLASVLYAYRGAAIVSFAWQRRKRASRLLAFMAVVAFFLLWRITIPAIMVLGLVDTGLDLRKRMHSSSE